MVGGVWLVLGVRLESTWDGTVSVGTVRFELGTVSVGTVVITDGGEIATAASTASVAPRGIAETKQRLWLA